MMKVQILNLENLYIEKDNKVFKKLVKSIDNVLSIIDVAGLHLRLNDVSGGFSLPTSRE